MEKTVKRYIIKYVSLERRLRPVTENVEASLKQYETYQFRYGSTLQEKEYLEYDNEPPSSEIMQQLDRRLRELKAYLKAEDDYIQPLKQREARIRTCMQQIESREDMRPFFKQRQRDQNIRSFFHNQERREKAWRREEKRQTREESW